MKDRQRRLWAPWRLGYISRARTGKGSSRCLFCEKGRSKADAKNLVIARGQFCFSLLNLFPYSNGHMLIAPYRHVAEVGSLHGEEWQEVWKLTDDAIRRLRRMVSPDGFNVGMNLGRAAGAGIPGHLHLHVVPRWVGDSNFMPILSHTRVLAQSLESARRLLRQVSC